MNLIYYQKLIHLLFLLYLEDQLKHLLNHHRNKLVLYLNQSIYHLVKFLMVLKIDMVHYRLCLSKKIHCKLLIYYLCYPTKVVHQQALKVLMCLKSFLINVKSFVLSVLHNLHNLFHIKLKSVCVFTTPSLTV
jgi:hypothetical protein